jgi:hypothetical protein
MDEIELPQSPDEDQPPEKKGLRAAASVLSSRPKHSV